jgi:NADH-ubiquinone oxidoreductase chain 5
MLQGVWILCNIKKFLFELVFISLNSLDFSFFFLFDWIRIFFIFIVLFISSIVFYYRAEYIKSEIRKVIFLYLVLFFIGSIVIIILGCNMVIILLGWDGLGLVSYCLVIYYQNEASRGAGLITVLTNRLGDVGILLSLVFMSNFGSWGFFNFILSGGILYYVGGLIILGALTKSAQVPFSAWLPAAIAAPTPVSSLVHSSTLVTAGVYLVIRLSAFYIEGALSSLLIFISVITIFLSGLRARYEIDIKKIIALSTLSQLGVIIIILSVGYYNLAFFHLLTHAIFKAILFLCAGVVIHGVGAYQDIRAMGLIRGLRPLLRGLMCLASLSLIGFPFLRGFYSKDLGLELMYLINNRGLLIGLILLATILTVFYNLRLIYYSL